MGVIGRPGSVRNDVPYLVALSPIELDLPPDHILISAADIQGVPAIVKAVYGAGVTQLILDRQNGRLISVDHEDRHSIRKGLNVIRTDMFVPSPRRCDPYRGLAGVLYSGINFSDYGYPPRDEDLATQFVLAHNMNAATHMRQGLMRLPSEWVASYTDDAGTFHARNIAQQTGS